MTIYDFQVTDNKGNIVSLKQYKGKVLLVVNTAVKCGLTPQYEELENIYQSFKEQGFEILDFPCNQFLEQAPGTDEEIDSFCTLEYNTTFPRFQKIAVNGESAHPLYKWLKEQAPVDKADQKAKEFEQIIKEYTPDNGAEDIKWNFGKFLIDRRGNVVERYSPNYELESLKKEIKQVLAQ